MFLFNILIAFTFFLTKVTCFAFLDKHSNPNEPVPENKSKIYFSSNLIENLFE